MLVLGSYTGVWAFRKVFMPLIGILDRLIQWMMTVSDGMKHIRWEVDESKKKNPVNVKEERHKTCSGTTNTFRSIHNLLPFTLLVKQTNKTPKRHKSTLFIFNIDLFFLPETPPFPFLWVEGGMSSPLVRIYSTLRSSPTPCLTAPDPISHFSVTDSLPQSSLEMLPMYSGDSITIIISCNKHLFRFYHVPGTNLSDNLSNPHYNSMKVVLLFWPICR